MKCASNRIISSVISCNYVAIIDYWWYNHYSNYCVFCQAGSLVLRFFSTEEMSDIAEIRHGRHGIISINGQERGQK